MLALVQDLLERVAKAQRIARQQREELARAKEGGAKEGGTKEGSTKEGGKGSKAMASRSQKYVEMATGGTSSDKGAASDKSFRGVASDTFTPKRKQLPPSLALPQGLGLPKPKEGAPKTAVPKLSTVPGHIRV